jgi:hypothetical protein
MLWAPALLAALLAQAGCGSRDAQVQGTVQVDGKPLEKGWIIFVPADGKTKTAGGEIKGGHYSVKVPVGTMKVSISAPQVVGKKKLYDTPDSPEQDVTSEALPPRYNRQSDLTLDVKPGTNPKDYDLTSQ